MALTGQPVQQKLSGSLSAKRPAMIALNESMENNLWLPVRAGQPAVSDPVSAYKVAGGRVGTTIIEVQI